MKVLQFFGNFQGKVMDGVKSTFLGEITIDNPDLIDCTKIDGLKKVFKSKEDKSALFQLKESCAGAGILYKETVR